MPYYHLQDWCYPVGESQLDSHESLKAHYHLLGIIEISEEKFLFWLHKSRASACVSVESRTYSPSHEIATSLDFSPRDKLESSEELHVNCVKTRQEFRGKELAVNLYLFLAKYSIVVVSDFFCCNGGKALWKQIARFSNSNQCSVKLWCCQYGDWLRDSSGDVVKYRGDNIPDSEIWHKDTTQSTTLLVLSAE